MGPPVTAAARTAHRRREVLVEAIGQRLGAEMARLGISDVQLGTRAGLPSVRIKRLRMGAAVFGPDAAEAQAIARVLDCEPAWLLWGTL